MPWPPGRPPCRPQVRSSRGKPPRQLLRIPCKTYAQIDVEQRDGDSAREVLCTFSEGRP